MQSKKLNIIQIQSLQWKYNNSKQGTVNLPFFSSFEFITSHKDYIYIQSEREIIIYNLLKPMHVLSTYFKIRKRCHIYLIEIPTLNSLNTKNLITLTLLIHRIAETEIGYCQIKSLPGLQLL